MFTNAGVLVLATALYLLYSVSGDTIESVNLDYAWFSVYVLLIGGIVNIAFAVIMRKNKDRNKKIDIINRVVGVFMWIFFVGLGFATFAASMF